MFWRTKGKSMTRNTPDLWRRFLVLALFCTSIANACQAQDPKANPPQTGEDQNANVRPQRLPTDRKTIQILKTLRESLDTNPRSAALDDFRTLQTADPMTLVPSESEDVYVPLFRAVFQIAYRLTPDQRRSLAEAEAGRMRRRLAQAVQEGDLHSISEVVLAGAATPSAIDAHWVVARLHLAKGNVVAARNWLLPLSGEGFPANVRQQAETLLASLAEESVGNKPQGAESANEPETPGGDATKTRALAVPNQLLWQSRPVISLRLRKQLELFLQSARGVQFAPQSIWKEVVESKRIYRRSLRGVAAIDTETGETIWEYPLLPAIEPKISSKAPIPTPFQGLGGSVNRGAGFASMDSSPIASAFCRDNSLGRISADQKYIYLTQTEPDYGASRNVSRFVPFGQPLKREGGRIIAVDKKTGRRIWTLSENTFQQHLGDSSSSGWIAGPPLSDGQFLYAVFEWDGEMRLGCISRNTGELLWSSVLAFPEQTIDRDPVRALWGCTPVRHKGLIWCHTTTGWLTCIDEATQSVVFASELHKPEKASPEVRFGRNQAIVFTRSASLKDRWSVARMIPSDERVAVFSHEAREIVWIEAASGEQLRRVAVESGEVLIHANTHHILLSLGFQLRALDTYSGELLWKTELPETAGFPFGQAAIHKSQLVVPLSEGKIATIDPTSGIVHSTSERILPAPAWGRLRSADDNSGDLYFLAADRIWRLSDKPGSVESGSKLEVALGLLEAGAWQAALDTATQIAPSPADRARLDSIVFTARLQLAARNPDADLQQIRNMALNDTQKLELEILEACVAHQRNDDLNAASHLLNVLDSPDTQLKSPVPDVAHNWARVTQPVATGRQKKLVPRATLLTWAAGCLTEILDNDDVDETVLERLKSYSDLVVTRISHPRLVPQLRARVLAESSVDRTLYGLRKLMALRDGREAASQTSAEYILLKDKLAQLSTSEQISTLMEKRLLATVIDEFGSPFDDLSASAGLPVNGVMDLRKNLSADFAAWDSQKFERLPIGRTPFLGSTARVYPVRDDAPFLSRYSWSIIRSSTGRLQAVSLDNSKERWSIPGNMQAYGTYTGWSDQLFRVGSVILLRTSRSLTAVSVFEERVLWRRSSFNSGISRIRKTPGNFVDFDGQSHPLPSHTNVPTFQIAGQGQNWVCILHGNSIEVLDTLSGTTFWKLDLQSSVERVVATDAFVALQISGNEDAAAFETYSGQPVTLKNSQDILRHGITQTPIGLAMWRKPSENSPRQVQWIHPDTGAVQKSVELLGKHFHFLDDSTLVGFLPNEKFVLTNLSTGQQETHSYAASPDIVQVVEPIPDIDLTPLPGPNQPQLPGAQPARPPANLNQGPPDQPLWSTERSVVVRDACHFFVSNHPGNNQSTFRSPFGQNSSLVVGGLRMLNRDTGEIQLALETSERLIASTDQPELGILALLTEGSSTANQGEVIPTMLTGWSRADGRQLFRQILPARYGSRLIKYGSPEANVLDVAAQQFSIRIDGRKSSETGSNEK